ncbi:MAG: hypothetical protein KDD55_07445, partial [Bdellovibrionales bacterium]|nr:hypothetical protein [Bdellovibrionales bacterium]
MIAILFLLTLLCSSPALSDPLYLGSQTCKECHQREYTEWKSSEHHYAMQVATAESVLGDFSRAEHTLSGRTVSFRKEEKKFFISLEGKTYEILYTFGYSPLQQYLVDLGHGALHALPVAWDSRTKESGGQRWFILDAGKETQTTHPLHWTQFSFNWNTMCAECHTTNFQKNYDEKLSSYASTWSEVSVGCESCHGSAEAHLKEANNNNWTAHKGFRNSLAHSWQADLWSFQQGRSIATKDSKKADTLEVETCAQCHSRRLPIEQDPWNNQHFLDSFAPTLLVPPFYEPDGRVREETYVYGSFLQSKMYLAGVTCSDCHNPHSLALRRTGNELCLQCHKAQTYNSAMHRNKLKDSEETSCISCHMPQNTFMNIDARRDHSFIIPTKRKGEVTYEELSSLAFDISNETISPIRRASAIVQVVPLLQEKAIHLIGKASNSKHDLIRYGAAQVLSFLPLPQRVQIGRTLLQDKRRAIRIYAARELAGVRIPEDMVQLWEHALVEYRESLAAMRELPSTQLSLGILETKLQNMGKAKQHYERAISLNRHTVEAYVNLADLYRHENNDHDAEKVLLDGLAFEPQDPDLNLALGLLYGRHEQYEQAVVHLQKALQTRKDDRRILEALEL